MIKLTGCVQDGRFIPDTPQFFKDVFGEYEGKRCEVWVGAENEKRSLRFNRAYFGALASEFAKHTGYTNEQAHELLKREILGVETIEYNGQVIELSKRTSTMTNKQFGEFVKQAELFLYDNEIIQVLQFQEDSELIKEI